MSFPNPVVVQRAVEGKQLLSRLLEEQPEADELACEGFVVKRSSAIKGLQYYDIAIRLFVREVMNSNHDESEDTGADEWVDLSGLLAPRREIERLVADVADGDVGSTDELLMVLGQIHSDYRANAMGFAQNLMRQESSSIFIDQDHWLEEAESAYERWLRMVRDDAEKEFQLGDMSEDFLRSFLETVK